MAVSTVSVGGPTGTYRLPSHISKTVLSTVKIGPPDAMAQEEAEAEFTFSFEDDAEGWTVGLADLPVSYYQSIYEIDSGHRPLPDGLEGSDVYVQGHNRSDDLFIFLKRQVGGLQ